MDGGWNYLLKISRWDFKSVGSATRTTSMKSSVFLMPCIAERSAWRGVGGYSLLEASSGRVADELGRRDASDQQTD